MFTSSRQKIWLLPSTNFTTKCDIIFVRKILPLRGLISKPIERSYVPVKICASDSSPPFKRSACFYMIITGHFERFQNLNFETSFLKN